MGGNLLSKITYPYEIGSLDGLTGTSVNYSYDNVWKDKLISYGGNQITYDALGNPLSYYGATYTWTMGRQLSSIDKTGLDIDYKYNDAGIRIQKKVNSITTNYHLVGDKVTYESDGTHAIYYTYDAQDKLVSMNLTEAGVSTEYYYIRNVQDDIIGLLDKDGNQVVTYTYTAWGEVLEIDGSLKDTVGVLNPYRYRGYRYDTETGFYYLQSRYYNPQWGRFLNADELFVLRFFQDSFLQYNLFSYCRNNPVNFFDPSGYLSKKIYISYSTLENILVLVTKTQEIISASSLVVFATMLSVSLYRNRFLAKGVALLSVIANQVSKKTALFFTTLLLVSIGVDQNFIHVVYDAISQHKGIEIRLEYRSWFFTSIPRYIFEVK